MIGSRGGHGGRRLTEDTITGRELDFSSCLAFSRSSSRLDVNSPFKPNPVLRGSGTFDTADNHARTWVDGGDGDTT